MKKLAKPKRKVSTERIIFVWEGEAGTWEIRGLKPPLNHQWRANLEINEKLWRRLQKRGVIV
jgi:hypothetical protein